MDAAMMASKNGTPTPTLTPMMTLLLTPSVLPPRMLSVPAGEKGSAVDVGGGGTNDTGLPLVPVMAWIFAPKAITLATEFCVVAGNVASDPGGTAVTKVFVTVFLEVDCSDTGQFTSPVDKHIVAVCVILVVIVVVSRSSLATIVGAVAVGATVEAVRLTAQPLAKVVNHMGICVSGVGPQV